MSDLASQNDELSVVELLRTLWNKKKFIGSIAVATTLVAGIYSFVAEEKWTSKAEVIAPLLQDLGDYYVLKKEYARILGSDSPVVADISNGLFDKFNLLASSLDERRIFLKESELYKSLSDGKNEEERLEILNELSRERIKITKPDPKKEPNLIGHRIVLTGNSATSAQETLNNFISYINDRAYTLDYENFMIYFHEKVEDLKYEKDKIERDLKINKNVQLDNLDKAVSIATQAGIKDYSKGFDATNANEALMQNLAMNSDNKVMINDSKLSDSTYLFMLGEKYLQAQIDVIKKNNVVYPPRYYQVQELLGELEPLLEKAKSIKGKAFSYQASPDIPLKKDWPKRLILLALGLGFGLMLGSVIVLFQQIFKRN